MLAELNNVRILQSASQNDNGLSVKRQLATDLDVNLNLPK